MSFPHTHPFRGLLVTGVCAVRSGADTGSRIMVVARLIVSQSIVRRQLV